MEFFIRPIWPVDSLISITVRNGEAELWVYSFAEKDMYEPWILQRHIFGNKQEENDSISKSSN